MVSLIYLPVLAHVSDDDTFFLYYFLVPLMSELLGAR
jgi:hypothetical protein